MRDIGGEPQIREAVEQLEREEQVGRHAVAMRFHMRRDAGFTELVRQPLRGGQRAIEHPHAPDAGAGQVRRAANTRSTKAAASPR